MDQAPAFKRYKLHLSSLGIFDHSTKLCDRTATSALDSEVEAEIQSALASTMAGKTVIAIAHRISTITQMDRIIVIENGKIIEEGTHKSLIDLGGQYATYWNLQSKGFDFLT